MNDTLSSQSINLSLYGLDREYDEFTQDEKDNFLKTVERIKAYDYIDTSAFLQKQNCKKKRGIVSEILRKNLLSDEILRNLPLVYLGSGTDIEYPLAMGARGIRMVDFFFSDEKTRREVVERLQKITNQKIEIKDNKICTLFDFGQGAETITIELDASAYNPSERLDAPVYVPPEEIGVVLTYVANGPTGEWSVGGDIISKVSNGGAVIEDENVTLVSVGERTRLKLGRGV